MERRECYFFQNFDKKTQGKNGNEPTVRVKPSNYLQVANSKLKNTYLLLTEFQVRTVSYGPNLFPLIYRPSARAINQGGTETRIRNVQYGPRKRG